MNHGSIVLAGAGVLCLGAIVSAADADTKYDVGASGSEIRIGQTMPYSGPYSAAGVIGRTEIAYFQMINAHGGINGRHVRFISLDDGYSPPKTLELTQTPGGRGECPGDRGVIRHADERRDPDLSERTARAATLHPGRRVPVERPCAFPLDNAFR